MQQAGSTDAEAVKAIFDGPNFTFELFGFPDAKLGGIETYGIARIFPFPLAVSVIENG